MVIVQVCGIRSYLKIFTGEMSVDLRLYLLNHFTTQNSMYINVTLTEELMVNSQ